MALRLNKQIQIYGRTLNFDNAYVKVESVNGNKNYVQVIFIIRDVKDGVLLSTGDANFAPSMDGGNFIKQAYEHLKTLPEFAGAVDC